MYLKNIAKMTFLIVSWWEIFWFRVLAPWEGCLCAPSHTTHTIGDTWVFPLWLEGVDASFPYQNRMKMTPGSHNLMIFPDNGETWRLVLRSCVWEMPELLYSVWMQGYALLCVGYPSSDLEVETQDEDEVMLWDLPLTFRKCYEPLVWICWVICVLQIALDIEFLVPLIDAITLQFSFMELFGIWWHFAASFNCLSIHLIYRTLKFLAHAGVLASIWEIFCTGTNCEFLIL